MNYRQATAADIPALVELARVMHAESNYAPMDFDPEILTKTLHMLIDNGHFVVLAEKDGEIVAGMTGMISQSWFGKDKISTDMGMFVHPDHRGGMIAARFLKCFLAWSEAVGAKQARPGVSTGHLGAQKLYEGMGFEPAGSLYLMNLEGGGQ